LLIVLRALLVGQASCNGGARRVLTNGFAARVSRREAFGVTHAKSLVAFIGERGAHARVTEQERAAGLREDIVRADRVPGLADVPSSS
jgi:hypothetical protein